MDTCFITIHDTCFTTTEDKCLHEVITMSAAENNLSLDFLKTANRSTDYFTLFISLKDLTTQLIYLPKTAH